MDHQESKDQNVRADSPEDEGEITTQKSSLVNNSNSEGSAVTYDMPSYEIKLEVDKSRASNVEIGNSDKELMNDEGPKNGMKNSDIKQEGDEVEISTAVVSNCSNSTTDAMENDVIQPKVDQITTSNVSSHHSEKTNIASKPEGGEKDPHGVGHAEGPGVKRVGYHHYHLQTTDEIKCSAVDGARCSDLYEVLRRADLLSYHKLFYAEGVEDLNHLLNVDQEEFAEIMRLLGMASSPGHIMRFRKALNEWAEEKGDFHFWDLCNIRLHYFFGQA